MSNIITERNLHENKNITGVSRDFTRRLGAHLQNNCINNSGLIYFNLFENLRFEARVNT